MIAGREGERRLAILGGGSWGTALAIVLAPGFSEIRVWAHDPALVRDIVDRRENARYLPGIRIPEPVRFSHDPAWCLAGAALVLVAIPSAYLRETMGQVEDFIPPGIAVVSATKGLEPGSMLRMSQVIAQAAHLELERVLALSGPSFAAEVARGMPAAVVVAGAYGPARVVQAALVRPSFRIYTSDDLVGVELGGALKNVIAIGAGMIAGLGLGHNAVAALVTRGLAEITRLAVCLGARPSTLAGLAGLGDLVLTCTGDLSRNRELGIVLGKVNPARNLLHLPCMTTEGVGAASVAVAVAAVHGVEMPIAEQVQQVLEFGRSPQEAIRLLMERSLRGE